MRGRRSRVRPPTARSPPTVRSLLAAKAPQAGAWVTLSDAVAAETIGAAGFDVVAIDLQHGYATEATAGALIDAIGRTPATCLVRVAYPGQIGRVLDMGAAGVIVPMVSSAAEASAAVAACRYAPAGTRSWGPWWQGVRAGVAEPDAADAGAACVVMVETRAGLDAIDEIAAVDGLDAVYVGPNDLALSMGLGRVRLADSPELTTAVQHIVDTCRSAGLAIGVDSPGDRDTWLNRGATLVLHASDVALLRAAASAAALD